MFGKKKQKPTVVSLMRGKEVVYQVVLAEEDVTLSSAAGDWSVRFANTTWEYGVVNYLIKESATEELTELIRTQYMARLLCKDAKLVKEFYKECERAIKRIDEAAKKAKNKEDDAVILAEEKVLHEKTEESIVELENLKKDDKRKSRK